MVFCRDMGREVEDDVDARDIREVAGCCSIVLVVIGTVEGVMLFDSKGQGRWMLVRSCGIELQLER